MGYQVAYSVLQAGHYGVPQSRKRLIIIAAAQGEPLPLFPEPTYVFAAPHFSGPHFPRVTVSGWTVDPSGGEMPAGAPRRCITVWDVISDLPETAVQIQGGSEDGPAAVPYAVSPSVTCSSLGTGKK
jgi:DNA (cytosine-5)-methyltransferase 1